MLWWSDMRWHVEKVWCHVMQYFKWILRMEVDCQCSWWKKVGCFLSALEVWLIVPQCPLWNMVCTSISCFSHCCNSFFLSISYNPTYSRQMWKMQEQYALAASCWSLYSIPPGKLHKDMPMPLLLFFCVMLLILLHFIILITGNSYSYHK